MMWFGTQCCINGLKLVGKLQDGQVCRWDQAIQDSKNQNSSEEPWKELSKLSEWAVKQQMQFSVDKSTVMHIGARRL